MGKNNPQQSKLEGCWPVYWPPLLECKRLLHIVISIWSFSLPEGRLANETIWQNLLMAPTSSRYWHYLSGGSCCAVAELPWHQFHSLEQQTEPGIQVFESSFLQVPACASNIFKIQKLVALTWKTHCDCKYHWISFKMRVLKLWLWLSFCFIFLFALIVILVFTKLREKRRRNVFSSFIPQCKGLHLT